MTWLRRTGIAAAIVCLGIGALLGGGVTVAAQTVAPLALLNMIRVASLRIDGLLRRVDLMQLGPLGNYGGHAWIDNVNEPQPGIVAVTGWAFGCGYDESRIVVVVDDIELSNVAARFPRLDVNAAFATTCNVVGNTGTQALVDMAAFEPGLNSDHRHTFKIRVYPPAYTLQQSPPFQIVDSAPVVFYTAW